jgi:RNA recognition motif-containing protein
MGTKLHVENLDRTFDNQDLERLFTAFGRVRAAFVVCRPDTGRSTGAGVVEMESAGEANAAVAALHGAEHCGRRLGVVCRAEAESDADLAAHEVAYPQP